MATEDCLAPSDANKMNTIKILNKKINTIIILVQLKFKKNEHK